MFCPLRDKRGFTLIEIIAVLVILGIISAFAISRSGPDTGQLFTTRDALVSHLRLAQIRAMNTAADADSVWGLRFSSSTGYHLFYCAVAATCNPADNASKVVLPGADTADINLSLNGVTLSGTAFPVVIAFNRFGTPFSSAALTSATLINAPVNITLQSAGVTRTISITPQTGRISS